MAARFNPAPGWPPIPAGWRPPPGWTHDAGWPPAPAGWPFWVDDVTGVPVPDPTRTGPAWYLKKVVTDIVDGDTIDVLQGDRTERVRVIGIDTPERGECGFGEAADVLAGHVLGERVVLVPGAQDDRDRYDRILRYVDREADGLDAGPSLIESGHAIARYDSRDGYGRHEREDAYVAADAATGDALVCAAEPPPAPAAPAPAPLTSVSYANCDAVRAAGAAPIRAGDPGWDTKFDRDVDGVCCE
jgi:endonuclease YncB( thermonuclease family)